AGEGLGEARQVRRPRAFAGRRRQVQLHRQWHAAVLQARCSRDRRTARGRRGTLTVPVPGTAGSSAARSSAGSASTAGLSTRRLAFLLGGLAMFGPFSI